MFPFSPEEGTKAALMEHVDTEEAQRRAELAVDVQSDIIDAYNDSILGEEREVLCEGYDPQAQMFYGRSYAESPDIDGRIWFTADSEIRLPMDRPPANVRHFASRTVPPWTGETTCWPVFLAVGLLLAAVP